MITKAAKYAVRASIYLALYSHSKHKIGAKEIAENLEIPLPFLAKQLQQLSRSRLISSSKGPNGGFYINDVNRQKSLWDVILCIDGEEKFNECFLGKLECNNENPCSIHPMVVAFRENMKKEFRDKNMAEVVEQLKDGKSISL